MEPVLQLDNVQSSRIQDAPIPDSHLQDSHDTHVQDTHVQDTHGWERMRQGGKLRFFLTRALPFYGVPFAFVMWLFSTPNSWFEGVATCSLRGVLFASVLGFVAWHLEEAAYRKRQANRE